MSHPNGLQLADLGERIRDERARRSLSLEALARKARVSRSMLSAVERETAARPFVAYTLTEVS